MTTLQPIEPLDEHGPPLTVALTASELEVLRASRAVTLTRSESGDCWDLAAASLVGVVQLPTGRTLRIRPKVRVGRLLFLVAYARSQKGWRSDDPAFAEVDDLVPGMAVALAHHAEVAFRRGVLQGYRSREEALPELRGRLRTTVQVQRRFGMPLPLEVVYDDFTVDIMENRAIKTAAIRMLRLSMVPEPVAARLRHLVALLQDVTTLSSGIIPDVRYTRLNEHYRGAVTLARLILEATSFDREAGERRAVGFLFDMSRVFEDFLDATLTPALQRRGGRVAAQGRHWLDEEETVRFKPDLAWWRGDACRAVIDAKYKSIEIQGARHHDIYQLISYATVLGARSAHLVYAEGHRLEGLHRVARSAIRLHVHSVDLDQSPAALLASADDLAELIARSSRAPRAVPAA